MKKNTLSKNRRLTGAKQFSRLFDSPRIFRGAVLQVFYKVNDLTRSRIGITIKGRVTSVWRTKIKRIVRESFRTTSCGPPYSDVNFVLKPPLRVSESYAERLRADLDKWSKAQGST